MPGGGAAGDSAYQVGRVFADEADAVVAKLNDALDGLEEEHPIFGGDVEITPIEQSGTRRKSALMLTLAAGGIATDAVKFASNKIAGAYKKVI